MTMSDRGENFVNLAHALLRADTHIEPEPSYSRISLSFKALCMATLLTAFGSSAVTLWASEIRRPLNRYKRTELEALIYYAVNARGFNENDLRQDLRSRLEISNFDDLTEGDFLIARRYLQTLADK